MNEAAQAGAITDEEADDLSMADLILRGNTPDGQDLYVLCEAAVTVYDHDVLRAKRRAGILERATGITAHPLVIGQSAPTETLARSRRENVPFLLVPDMNRTDAGTGPGGETNNPEG